MAKNLILFILLFSSSTWAFRNGVYYAGLGYYSQNILGKTTTSSSSAPSTLGAASYPLTLKYDWNWWSEWYLSPQLSFTLMPRASAGDSAKVTIMHLSFPFGTSFGSGGSSSWDWYVGPGILRYGISGSGGTTVLNNGTGSATFALPGGTSNVQTISFTAGSSYNFESSRIGIDFIFEGLMSAGKRTESLMLSYGYAFGGGRF